LYIPVIRNQYNLNNFNNEQNKSDTTSRVADHPWLKSNSDQASQMLYGKNRLNNVTKVQPYSNQKRYSSVAAAAYSTADTIIKAKAGNTNGTNVTAKTMSLNFSNFIIAP
jgi:hypothetical protein